MAEDSESAASQQSLELDDQDTCGIDGDNEEENEHMQGWGVACPVRLWNAIMFFSPASLWLASTVSLLMLAAMSQRWWN